MNFDLMERARELSRRGEEIALATVVWRAAPTSGQTGARAIITSTGQIHGFIGGACAEPVVIREAQRVIRDRTARLLALGTTEQFGPMPEGMLSIVMSCASEGALQVYIEPVIPDPRLTVVGRSPMAQTLVDLAAALGWESTLVDGAEFSAANVSPRDLVVIATQGHGDEEALAAAVAAFPAFIGLVASRKRGETVLGTLADQGVPRNLLERVRVPVGLDLGHTTHREIAVAVLAELVQLRASGGLDPVAQPRTALPLAAVAEAIDPVCGMTVKADASARPYDYQGVTYYFCCPGCRRAFERDPAAYLTPQEA